MYQFLEVASDISGMADVVTTVTSMLTGVVSSVAGLIVQFPMNVFFGLTLIGAGVGLFRKIKHN